jgi:hypothetical protein
MCSISPPHKNKPARPARLAGFSLAFSWSLPYRFLDAAGLMPKRHPHRQ